MYTTVIVPFEFYASHSLSVREKPHNHYWALKLFVRGIPKNGMVIDILKLRQLTDPYVEKLADTYLNENPVLTEEQAACPTCEMLAAYFYTHVSQAIEALNAMLNSKPLKLSCVSWKEKSGEQLA